MSRPLLVLACRTWEQVYSIPGVLDALRYSLFELCRPATSARHRQHLWEAYEVTEERVMAYTQVCATDAREMACDNRHMQIGKRSKT